MTLDLHEGEGDDEVAECPRCHESDIGLYTLTCSVCHVGCCENCSSGGMCGDCESTERGIVTIKMKAE